MDIKERMEGFERESHYKSMDLKLLCVKNRKFEALLPLRNEFLYECGIIQNCVIARVADAASACVLLSIIEENNSIEFYVNFIRSSNINLVANASIVHKDRKIAIVSDVASEDKLVTSVHNTSMIL